MNTKESLAHLAIFCPTRDDDEDSPSALAAALAAGKSVEAGAASAVWLAGPVDVAVAASAADAAAVVEAEFTFETLSEQSTHTNLTVLIYTGTKGQQGFFGFLLHLQLFSLVVFYATWSSLSFNSRASMVWVDACTWLDSVPYRAWLSHSDYI